MRKMNREVLQEKVQNIEQGLKVYMPEESGYQKTVFEAMNYSLLAGGKRLRPLFMQETYRMFGGKEEKTIRPFMAALEMIHTYSLVHDDLPAMDNDDYRRGKLTNHKIFGPGMATMAGDGLLTYAFELISNQENISPDTRCYLISILAKAAGPDGMVGGQALDIISEGHSSSLPELRKMDSLKTGCLICAPIDMAALIAKCDEEMQKSLHEFAVHLGLLFQITDDLLDVHGSLKEMGKLPGQDEKSLKSTYVTILGEGKAQELANAENRRAKAAISKLGSSFERLNDLADYVLARAN